MGFCPSTTVWAGCLFEKNDCFHGFYGPDKKVQIKRSRQKGPDKKVQTKRFCSHFPETTGFRCFPLWEVLSWLTNLDLPVTLLTCFQANQRKKPRALGPHESVGSIFSG